MIAILIMVALAAALFPLVQAARDRSNNAVAFTQAQELGKGLMLYLQDSDNKYPPATNYGLPDSEPEKIWPIGLRLFVNNSKVFVAPGSSGVYPQTFAQRGEMTIGYSSATSIDPDQGCDDDQADENGCIAFNSVVSFDSGDRPAAIALFAQTPGGPTDQKYRGYEFNPYNGAPIQDRLRESPPLTSDRDLVQELAPVLPAAAIEPVLGRYLATGRDTGQTPVIFADGHAKSLSASAISGADTGIIWRFR